DATHENPAQIQKSHGNMVFSKTYAMIVRNALNTKSGPVVARGGLDNALNGMFSVAHLSALCG
ncbi:13446_t:CDS:2, partial [Racocetra persica]